MRAISKNKRFSSSFANGTIKFKYNYVTVENFNLNRLTYLTCQETALKRKMQLLRKKAWESFVFRKRCDWTIFFKAFRLEYPHCLELSAKSRAETGKKLLKTPQRSKPQNHDYYVEKHTKKHETWFLQKRCTNWNSSACLCISDTSNKVLKLGREVSSIRNTCELRQNHNDKPVRFSRISSLLHNREERCVTTVKRGCVVDYRISRVDLDQ